MINVYCSIDTDKEVKTGRSKRSSPLDSFLATNVSRNGRKFCENSGGV